jgi:hypothetical protein
MGIPPAQGARVRAIRGFLLAFLLLPTPLAAQQSYLLVVSGLSGEPRYADRFHDWATTMMEAAQDRWGVTQDNIVYLAEKTDRDPQRIAARSTRENVESAAQEIAGRASSGDLVFVLLIGHGATADGEARISLPGPDMSAADFAKLLDRFATQRVVFVNAASASGGFIPELSGENRAIITATRSGRERNETIFGEHFVEAYAADGADVDKDERVSALEAFEYARHEVARVYEADGRLLTEHALLDDDGDGEGSTDPDPRAGSEGQLARTLFLIGGPTVVAGEPADPGLVALYGEKRALEEAIAALRLRKDEMSTDAYEQELEELLVELALKTRQIRELEGKEQ